MLAVVRLGDADRLGWWRSHSVDVTAEYVLGDAFPQTWLATGVELAMESARLRHDAALERATAVHLFSDYLPFNQLLRSWLIERKLEIDTQPLAWLAGATVEELRKRLGAKSEGERRAGGLYLGDIRQQDLADDETVQNLLSKLAGGYLVLDTEFFAPYVDMVA